MTKNPDYSSKKFMIVDDMPFMLNLIHRMLKECGATYITKASDGASVLKMIKDEISQVDVIVADCNMKLVNGLQLLQAIRCGVNPRIPRDQAFIMLTGQGDANVVKSSMALDVSGYLMKPVALDKLVGAIERIADDPLKVREPEYYRSIRLAVLQGLEKDESEQAEDPHISAWVVMSPAARRRNEGRVKAKLDAFKAEQADNVPDATLKISNIRKCDLANLQGGMILAEDLYADAEHILLKRGVPLVHQ